jgi:hypothetical protein
VIIIMTFPASLPLRYFIPPISPQRPPTPLPNLTQRHLPPPQQEAETIAPAFIPTPSTSHEAMTSFPKQSVAPWLNDSQVFALGVLSGSVVQLVLQWAGQAKPALFNRTASNAEQQQQLLAVYEAHPEKAKAAVSLFTDQINWKIHEKAMSHCGLPPIPLSEIKQASVEGKVDSFIANRIARLLITLDDSMTAQQLAKVVSQYQAKEKTLMRSFNQQVQTEVAKTNAENRQKALKNLGLEPLQPEDLTQSERTTLALRNRALQKMGEPPVASDDAFEQLAGYIKNSVDDILKAINRQELAQQTETFWKVLLTTPFDIDGDTLQLVDTDQGKALLAELL